MRARLPQRPRARRRVPGHGRAAREPRRGARRDRGACSEPCALGIDARAITVCTAGLPVGIRRLAREAPKVRLGLSIDTRVPSAPQSLMPIATRARARRGARRRRRARARHRALADVGGHAARRRQRLRRRRARARRSRARVRGRDRPAAAALDHRRTTRSATTIRSARSPREAEFRAALGMPSHRRYSGGSDVGVRPVVSCVARMHPVHDIEVPDDLDAFVPTVIEIPQRLAPQVRGRQADRPASGSIACSTARCTTRRTTGSSRARTATTAIRSTSSSLMQEPVEPLTIVRARRARRAAHERRRGRRRPDRRQCASMNPAYADVHGAVEHRDRTS